VIVTQYVRPPVPTNKWDWMAYIEGDEEASGPTGRGPTEAEALRDLCEQLAGGRFEGNPDAAADALRFRWLCEHPDWHFIERLCREFVADSSTEFLRGLRRVIDARRSVELGPFDAHKPANSLVT
jgi:hypothetical protein